LAKKNIRTSEEYESTVNYCTKRYKLYDEIYVGTNPAAKYDLSTGNNPTKYGVESFLDYIIEKQVCDIPDIFEADG